MLKKLGRSRRVQRIAGRLGAAYLTLVHRTNRFVMDPPNVYEQVDHELPVIVTIWHGQHLLMPFIRQPHHRAKVLISRHRDGEINALAAEHLGVGTIRGSGDTSGRFHLKGGASAFRTMLETLEEGINVAMTADVPKIARRAGMGVVKLAAMSGRPIAPIGLATQRRIVLDNWDRTAINLPFGRGAMVLENFIRVPHNASDEELEAARLEVERALNAATSRAYEIVDRR